VARRIATMDRTSPEVLREVERVLEKKLSTMSSEDYTAAGGVENIVEILNLVDRASEKQIIEALEDEDPELAEEIKKRMFVFEDIVMLDDRAIQKVMREVDSQELAKALKSVDTEVQDKIFKNMSKRAATMLKEDMEYMGPVRLKDVEEAQQKIVSIIRHLEDTGEIVVARSGEDEMVV
ncbi:MAG: flagellar motor switch protein FliG, partial [Treponema sp.]|nr:flagellar motor switch protein FliG [Treponema sp.]